MPGKIRERVSSDFIKPAAMALGKTLIVLSKELGFASDKALYSHVGRGYTTPEIRDKIKKLLEDAGKPFPNPRRRSVVHVKEQPDPPPPSVHKEKIISFKIWVPEAFAPSVRAIIALLGHPFDQSEEK